MTQATSKSQPGFTLIELILALSFVGFLLLFVFFAMNQVIGNYNKGLTVKTINQTARTIAEDMSRAARTTDSQSINLSKVADGRACFGGVSYVWNINGATANQFDTSGPATPPDITLVRVVDSGEMCADTAVDVPYDKSTILLGESVLVQDLQVTAPNAGLVSIDLALSTAGDNAPTVDDPDFGKTCGGDRDSQFCAVARFSTTVSTRNGGQ